MIFPLNTVKILGISVSCAKRENVLHLPLKWASETNKRTILYVNAHCMNLAANDLAYREALNRADLVYSDGIGVVWAAKYLGGCTLEKVTGRDWIHDFCSLSEKNDLRLYILAGSPGIAQTARQNITKRYPRLQIVGVHPGFLDEKEMPGLLAEINQANPHALLVGMGTPQQEKWLASYRSQIEAPVCWAVGALFDYVAGVEPPVPDWLNRLNLEWLWRMLVDPIGKWRRYLVGNPIFMVRILRQKRK